MLTVSGGTDCIWDSRAEASIRSAVNAFVQTHSTTTALQQQQYYHRFQQPVVGSASSVVPASLRSSQLKMPHHFSSSHSVGVSSGLIMSTPLRLFKHQQSPLVQSALSSRSTKLHQSILRTASQASSSSRAKTNRIKPHVKNGHRKGQSDAAASVHNKNVLKKSFKRSMVRKRNSKKQSKNGQKL